MGGGICCIFGATICKQWSDLTVLFFSIHFNGLLDQI